MFLLAGCGGEPVPTLESAQADPLTGTTCEQLAAEVGSQLDAKMLEVMDGPSDTNGESRAARSWAWRVVIFQNLNAHLRELGIRDDCEAERMFDLMEGEFSPEFVERVGDYLWDQPDGTDEVTTTWSYDEWRESALQDLRIIDGE
ncbi:MAG TPA: hypothetical protein VK906_05945 [Egicoccus sp.]|nr:hypothetical protein [Egicoccus sp.]HSK22694.1 hypothetical protein [Egicoccus sp.]